MPKDPRKFQFSFEKTGLTRFGGLSLFQSFCKYLCLRRLPWVYALCLGSRPGPKIRTNNPINFAINFVFSP
jgi:hypothetical protein